MVVKRSVYIIHFFIVYIYIQIYSTYTLPTSSNAAVNTFISSFQVLVELLAAVRAVAPKAVASVVPRSFLALTFQPCSENATISPMAGRLQELQPTLKSYQIQAGSVVGGPWWRKV